MVDLSKIEIKCKMSHGLLSHLFNLIFVMTAMGFYRNYIKEVVKKSYCYVILKMLICNYTSEEKKSIEENV